MLTKIPVCLFVPSATSRHTPYSFCTRRCAGQPIPLVCSKPSRYGFSPRSRTSTVPAISFSFSLQNSLLPSTYIFIITLTSRYPICLPSYSGSFRLAYEFTSYLHLSIVIRSLRFILSSLSTPPKYATELVSSFNKCSLIAQNIRPPCLSNRTWSYTSHPRLECRVFFSYQTSCIYLKPYVSFCLAVYTTCYI